MLDLSIVDVFNWIIGIVDDLCTGIIGIVDDLCTGIIGIVDGLCITSPWIIAIVASWTIVDLNYQLIDENNAF